MGQDFKENECSTLSSGEEGRLPSSQGNTEQGAALSPQGGTVPQSCRHSSGPGDKDGHAHSVVFKSHESETTQMASSHRVGDWLPGHGSEHDAGVCTRA